MDKGPLREVVVGVDDSHESMAAARWAASIAARSGASLTVVHAWHYPYAATPMGVHGEVISLTQEGATAVLNRAVATLEEEFPDLTPKRELISGSAFRSLVDHSAEADLIVVGRHGRNAINRLFLGSTSTAVANHSRCPVAVVPADVEPLPADPLVMIAIDGSARSLDAATWALVAVPDVRRFVAVHSHDEWVLDNLSTPDTFRDQRHGEAEKLVGEAIEFAKKQAGRPGVAFEQLVIPGDPRETVMRFSQDADVLVVGARGHTGLSGVLLGSFATYALHHASVPLMIVQDGWAR